MPPVIRPARAEDLPQVSQLAAQLVRQHHDMDPQRFLLVEPIAQGYQQFFHGELSRKKAVILVAQMGDGAGGDGADNAIVGYAYGTLEPRNWNDLLDTCGKLNDVFVDAAARRSGIGRLLVQQMIAALRARGAPRIVLLTGWRNPDAHAFFESLGFRRTMLEMTAELTG